MERLIDVLAGSHLLGVTPDPAHALSTVQRERHGHDCAPASAGELPLTVLTTEPVLTGLTRQRSIHVGILDRFLNQMRPGDLIATVDGANLYIGTVTGEPTWTDSPDGLATHRRTVRWINAGRPFTRDQLSASTRDRLSGQMTVSSLGPDTAEFAALADLDCDIAPIDLNSPEAEPAPLPVELPDPTDDLARELLVDIDWLTDTIDLLREKKQLVLYGPPGTGKTYLAQELARFLTEQTGGDYRLVQFHPSYSYEDFFEGFRPQVGATPGTITLSLEDGPFKLLVKQAAQDVSRAYVLVIDELNRANLAKVFGELYFLLEYRNRAVQLQYSPAEDFRLPGNLYLIGTMNTADRSIALVDAAMRRRFAWQGPFPGESPVADMLRKWLRNHNLPADRADLLDALNARIGERDAAIGPSYLMTPRVASEEGLAKVWKHHIMPLLEERHVGEDIDLHRHYGLQALRKGTGWRPTAPAGEDLSEETGRGNQVRRLTLSEHTSRAYPSLARPVAEAFAATGAVKASVDFAGRTVLTSSSHIGVLRAADVELRITPKISIYRLLWLVGHARDPRGWRDQDIVSLSAADDLVSALAVSFLAAARRAFAAGVLQGYRTTEEAQPMLRWRLREGDQLRSRLGIAVPLEVRYDDYRLFTIEGVVGV